jgi:uncharacterized protein
MRTFDAVVSLGLIGLALGLPPAASFDGVPEAPAAAVAPPDSATRDLRPMAVPMSRGARSGNQALRSGIQALRDGKPDEAVTALEYAAGQGVPDAMWKLGRMYAYGDVVEKNPLRAFEYFRALAKAHAFDPPGTPQARFAADAFVALGRFHLDGIPNTRIKPDARVAHERFLYAASYFGDADAQYNLGRLYLQGRGVPKDAIQAARWLGLAADKGHRSAQAALGAMLFTGEGVARQPARGLAWLTVAKDGAGPDEAWIAEIYSSAFAQASDRERQDAYRVLENILQGRRK